jgi:GAF domain-containing protein
MSTSQHGALPPSEAPMPAREGERMASLRRYEILDTPPEQVFDDLTWLASFICQAPMALVTLVDERRQWFKARVGFEGTESPRNESICAHAIVKPDGLLEVPDTARDRRFAGMAAVVDAPFVRFYAGAPLVSASGHAVGTVCVMDREPRTLSADQRRALRIIAAQVVSQFELRRPSGGPRQS